MEGGVVVVDRAHELEGGALTFGEALGIGDVHLGAGGRSPSE